MKLSRSWRWSGKWDEKNYLLFLLHTFWLYCLLYYRRFPLLCIKRDAPCQLQINCHFHFLNFPTVSSLLHIRKILVHWPFLKKIIWPQKMGCRGHFGPQAEISGWNTGLIIYTFCTGPWCWGIFVCSFCFIMSNKHNLLIIALGNMWVALRWLDPVFFGGGVHFLKNS